MTRKAVIIDLINQGLSNKEIAARAFCVECYVSNVRTEVGKNLRSKKRNYMQTVELSELSL